MDIRVEAPSGRHRTRRLRNALFVGAAILLTAGCAAGVNEATGGVGSAGFWLGLWHGFILPVTFVISLFTDTVNLYEVNNNGNWYDVGFFLGVSSILSGGSGAASRSRG